MQTFDCQVLYRPENEALSFLPEGPFACGDGKFSWVAIQHGAESTVGSLNVFDLGTRQNTSYDLDGRPGFAFATVEVNTFVLGVERRIGLFNIDFKKWTTLRDDIDRDVAGTIINDGVSFERGLVFGSKDLMFEEKKAGLYLWRCSDRALFQLRSDQVCSNGKVVFEKGNRMELLDIDSPTKTVVRYILDVDAGKLSEPQIVIDLRDGDVFPDGMIQTPDGESVIIALYNPNQASHGEAHQYNLTSGNCEAVWKTDASPQVTCPLLIQHEGQVKLILTTAVEHMSPEHRERNPNAGCLFIADTPFDSLPKQPEIQII